MEDKNSQNWNPQNRNTPNGGNEFWDVIQNAINTGNYQELNSKVKHTITDTAEEICNIKDEFLDGFLGGASQTKTPAKRVESYAQSGWNAVRKTVASKLPMQRTRLYMKNPPGEVSGLFQAIFGFGMGVMSLLFTVGGIGVLIEDLQLGIVSDVVLSLFMILLCGVVAGLGIGMGVSGMKKRNFVRNFRNYVKIVGDRGYCSIEDLVNGTGRKKAAIIKDLKGMIARRFFLQGHLDKQETCLIVTHEMYNQYLLADKQAKERELLEQAEKARLEKIPEESRPILEEGRAYIAFIREANDKLPGEVISTKLDRLELIITRIFAEVEVKPEIAGDLRKFMNYYLPMTKKLVQAYCDLEQEPISSETMRKTKLEIEDTLDTINEAFENLLNSFFDTKALDISSDISVLHTMLAQEGLTKASDFKK